MGWVVSGKFKILLAEQEPSAAEQIRSFLEDSYHVVIVSDGLAALRGAREQEPDLIITAILLPRLDGFQLCRDLKDNANTADIPILALSFLLAESRIKQAGADAFLPKPVERKVLRRAVGRLIGRRQGQG